jgi:creatinine amidohydrolase
VKYLAELTWTEAREMRDRHPITLLPIGSTEAHGPHLPLSTDTILSLELARRSAHALETEGCEAVIAPPLSYALTDYAGEFTGTISVAGETAARLVSDICCSLLSQGFDRICLVNSHLEPAHVVSLRDAVKRVVERTGRMVAFPDQTERRWARTLSDEYKRGACHAGCYETSLLLAARPELVRDEKRARLPPLPIDLAKAMKEGVRTFGEAGASQAYFGDPASATRAEGDDLYARLTAMVVATVRETWPETITATR